MARFPRVLTAKEVTATPAVAAPPPEAVALESDLVVILSVLLCALISVVGLIAAARCACRRRRNAEAAARGANKGLKKKVLQSLPKFTYTTTASSICDGMKVPAMLSSECPICLGEFVEGVEVRMLPNCGHGFHVACIDKWLGSHSSCPSCRQVVVVVGRCGKCGQSLSSAMAVGEPPVNGPLHVTVHNAFMP